SRGIFTRHVRYVWMQFRMTSELREKQNQKLYNMQLNPMLAIFNLGGGEIILILAIVLILFGAKKLPELAKGLGQGIKEFKKATDNASEGMREALEETSPSMRLFADAPPSAPS